jgi:hypothetical protein
MLLKNSIDFTKIIAKHITKLNEYHKKAMWKIKMRKKHEHTPY